MPYELLAGDLSQVNYSSIRAGLVEFRRMIDAAQWQLFIPMLCAPVWRWFTEAAWAAGQIPTPDVPAEWSPPKLEAVDPQKDAIANLLSIRSGTMTLAEVIAQQGRNTLPNPYSDDAAETGQPTFPWRGRITCSPAAGYAESVDKTATAVCQVAAFFGSASSSDFAISGDTVSWTGPTGDWGLRRMMLHYAHLCAVAGGVDAFLIGSEMRGLTTIRSSASSYPAVTAFKALAADVRTILGAGTEIGQPWRRPRTPGDLTIRWTRRSHVLAADSWRGLEVSLAEELEAYGVEVLDGATVKRVLSAATTSAVYTAAAQITDWRALLGSGDTLDIRIYQLSAIVGRGAPKTVTLTF